MTKLLSPSFGNSKREITAKRYGVDIFLDEYNLFRDRGIISKSIIVFFFGFLQERQDQIPSQELEALRQRILCLGPQFYERLTDNKPMTTNINYDKVKSITEPYTGAGNVVFDVFDKVAIVVRSETGSYMLAYIDTLGKRIVLFDPMGNTEQSPVNNPVLFNVSQFIELEYQNKANQTINLAKWRFAYGDITRLNDINESGLLTLKLVHSIYNNSLTSHATNEDLRDFKMKLLTLIGHIGVTNNKKGELGSFEKYPL